MLFALELCFDSMKFAICARENLIIKNERPFLLTKDIKQKSLIWSLKLSSLRSFSFFYCLLFKLSEFAFAQNSITENLRQIIQCLVVC